MFFKPYNDNCLWQEIERSSELSPKKCNHMQFGPVSDSCSPASCFLRVDLVLVLASKLGFLMCFFLLPWDGKDHHFVGKNSELFPTSHMFPSLPEWELKDKTQCHFSRRYGLFCSAIMVTKNPLNQAFFLREVLALRGFP